MLTDYSQKLIMSTLKSMILKMTMKCYLLIMLNSCSIPKIMLTYWPHPWWRASPLVANISMYINIVRTYDYCVHACMCVCVCACVCVRLCMHRYTKLVYSYVLTMKLILCCGNSSSLFTFLFNSQKEHSWIQLGLNQGPTALHARSSTIWTAVAFWDKGTI